MPSLFISSNYKQHATRSNKSARHSVAGDNAGSEILQQVFVHDYLLSHSSILVGCCIILK